MPIPDRGFIFWFQQRDRVRRRRARTALAEPTVPPALPPSYAVTAAGCRCLRSAVGGLRRVLALDFQAGFPAGAVGLFIHWRWQPTGAGDLAIIANKATANTSGLLNFV